MPISSLAVKGTAVGMPPGTVQTVVSAYWREVPSHCQDDSLWTRSRSGGNAEGQL